MVVHKVALTFDDHSTNIESKFFGSLLFLFGKILVRVIGLIIVVVWQIKIKNQNNPWIQSFYSHLQYANNVDKKYEKINGKGFVKKCWNRPHN